jgi:hypothetical protein
MFFQYYFHFLHTYIVFSYPQYPRQRTNENKALLLVYDVLLAPQGAVIGVVDGLQLLNDKTLLLILLDVSMAANEWMWIRGNKN